MGSYKANPENPCLKMPDSEKSWVMDFSTCFLAEHEIIKNKNRIEIEISRILKPGVALFRIK